MGRIEQTFEQLKERQQAALIPFITAGDPNLETTEQIIYTLVDAGVDLIELGVPFSDPMADGPTIQASSERALAAGATLKGVLALVERVRQRTQVPIVLMGYYNPILRYGAELFSQHAKKAGVDGLLIVDLPHEEKDELCTYLNPQGVHLITLLAPTTPAPRAEELLSQARGFVYYVSITGVTGTTKVDVASIEAQVKRLRDLSPVPVAVGFGITTAEDAEAIARFSDAVVFGSALVNVIKNNADSSRLLEEVYQFVDGLKQGILRATDITKVR